MATLNSSNIVNGNIIQTADILQLYNALTAGGGYNVSISGSITGSATTASFVTTAQTASFVTTAQTASYVLNAVSSSYASGSSLITSQHFINSATPGTVSTGNFKFIAGGGILNNGEFTSSAYTPLAGKLIGKTAFISVSYFGDPTLVASNFSSLVVNITDQGAILISQAQPNDDAEIVWTGIYV
jgi:hypothetical protein